MSDFRGYSYEKQRDAWKEGTDFSFAAEFYAISDKPLINAGEIDVIDTEVVDSNEDSSVSKTS